MLLKMLPVLMLWVGYEYGNFNDNNRDFKGFERQQNGHLGFDEPQHVAYGAEKDRLDLERQRHERQSSNSYAGSPSVRGSEGVPLDKLIPFGLSNGDLKMPAGDDNSIEVQLKNEQFIFFNSSYNKLFINTNGGVSFKNAVRTFTPNCSPQGTPMIIPFWADINTNVGGSVYYRQTSDSSILGKVEPIVRKAFPNSRNLNLKWVFITTWDSVAYFGAPTPTNNCPGSSLRNTFQVILVKDEHHSFVLFYYNKINWTTGTASSTPSAPVNRCTGTGGMPAKAGFDYGDHSTFFTVPKSCTGDIINIAAESNFLEKGKWAFRVTDVVEDPCEVKCLKNDLYHSNPFNCSQFYQCSNGWPYLHECPPPGLVFRPDKNVCDWPQNYPCEPICRL